MSITVESKVLIYAQDGKKLDIGLGETISVESHWLRREFVVLNIQGKRVTVAATDLELAIANAKNRGL